MEVTTNWAIEAEISPDLDQRIRDALCVCFPDGAEHFSTTRSWHGSVPSFSAWAEDSSQSLVAHVGVHERTVDAGGQQVRIGGIMNVCVLPDYRGSEMFSRIMGVAHEAMHSRGLDAGLLFCLPVLTKVYGKVGWKTLEDTPVTRVDEHGKTVALPEKNVTMWFPLKTTTWPTGPIHLQGNDW